MISNDVLARATPLLDDALDLSVVGGYSKLGYLIRSRSWDPADCRRLDGRVVLVTGASSGLGRAAAEGFAALGARVHLLVRDRDRGERARAEILSRVGKSPGLAGGSPRTSVEIDLCDLSDLRSVREFAAHFRAVEPQLDVLVNNAGVLSERRQLSVDGIELTLATNVIGPFLLSNLLSAGMGAGARIINVSSGGMYTQRIDVEDLQSEHGEWSGAAAYARSKRAQVILTELGAQRLAATGVVVHAMHPGWVDTPGLARSLPHFYRLMRPLLRSAQQGADTVVWLGAADAPAASSGGFWQDRRQRPTHRLARTRESAAERQLLWDECVRLSGGSGPLA